MPLYRFTVLPASAVPVNAGVVSLVTLPSAIGTVPSAADTMTGAAGAVVSMVTVAGPLALPAASTAETCTVVPPGIGAAGV